MKLPEFKSTTSASMQSAMMTPQLRPMTIANRAPQHNVMAGQLSRQDAERNAMAKYLVPTAIAKGVGDMIKIKQEIDLADEQMSMELAGAEYTKFATEFSTNEVREAQTLDANGRPMWETSEERFLAAKEGKIAELRDKHRFSNKELEHKFGLKTMAADMVSGERLNKNTYTNKIARGKANYFRNIDLSDDPQNSILLTNAAFKAGYITEGFMVEANNKFRSQDRYESYAFNMQTTGRSNLYGLQQGFLDGTHPDYDRFDETQRANLSKLAKKEVINRELNISGDVYEKSGTMGMAKRERDVYGMSAQDLGFTSEEDKYALMTKLNKARTRMESLEVEKTDKQEIVNMTDGLFAPQFGTANANAMNALMENNPKAKKQMNDSYASVIGLPPEEFYDENSSWMMMGDRLAQSKHTPKMLKSRLEGDLRSEQPGRVMGAYSYIQGLNEKYGANSVNVGADAKDQMSFIKSRVENTGSYAPLFEQDANGKVIGISEDWKKFSNLTPDEERLIQKETNLLFDKESVDKRVRRLTNEFEIEDTDRFLLGGFNEVSLEKNEQFMVLVEEEIRQEMINTGKMVFAEREGFKNATMRFGITDKYGDRIVVKDGPEVITPRLDNRPHGSQSDEFDGQYYVAVDRMNAELKLDGKAGFEYDELREEHMIDEATGKDIQILTIAATGETIISPITGDRYAIGYESVNPQTAIDSRVTVQNEQSNVYVEQLNEMLADSTYNPIGMPVDLDPVTMTIASDIDDAIAMNAETWNKASDIEKYDYQQLYYDFFNAMVDEYERKAPYGMSYEGMEMRVHIFLASRGYVRGNTNGEYIPPPVIK